MLRRLNRYANGEAAARRLDFMVFTGDIIDFCIKSDNTDPKPDFDYPSTNWERFIDLLLNQPIQGFQGYPLLNIETNEELLVPIFTIWETMIIEWAIIPLRPLAFSNNLDYVYMNLRCMKI